MTPEQERARAFAAALEGLFEMYPLPEYKYQKTAWQRQYDRDTAIKNARDGCSLYMVDILAHGVPSTEIRNIHSLIYG